MKPATEILLSAAFALTPREHWTKGAHALRHDFSFTEARNPDAACWCVDGALIAARVDGRYRSSDYYQAYDSIMSVVGGSPISWNDEPHRRHAQVLNALYRAAELSERATVD